MTVASRRDLIQSLQFAARRVVSAVVLRRTDPREWPFRRLGGAGVGSVMLAVVALGGVGVYGMVFPGGKTSWRDGRSVVVDSRSGASYVYVDGALHPVLNFASAALVVGSTAVTTTAPQSLAGVPRGGVVGIRDAPTALPTADELVTPPWALCSEQVADAGGTVSRTRLVVGRDAGAGRLPGEAALLVTDTSDGTQHLVWRDHRYLLADKDVDRVALQLDGEVAVPVGHAWLTALPAGRPFTVLRPPGSGRPSQVPGATVGQLVKVVGDDRGTQYYVATATRLVPVTPVQAEIQRTADDKVLTLSPAAVAGRTEERAGSSDAAQPAQVPEYVQPQNAETVVCATYRDGDFTPQVVVDSQVPAGGGVATVGTTSTGTALADRVWVPPGRAALVEALPSAQSQHGPLYLVTDAGRRYPVPSADVLRALGLAGTPTSKLPAGLVVRIPEGPALDPAAARAGLDDAGSGG